MQDSEFTKTYEEVKQELAWDVAKYEESPEKIEEPVPFKSVKVLSNA